MQRKCSCGGHDSKSEDKNSKKTPLQRKGRNPGMANRGGSAAPPIVHEVLHSPGQPLDSSTRAFMEPRFGRSFGQVRVHTDAKAAESARAVNALAYTVGSNIVFDQGRYQPQSPQGSLLMAHELVHTLQQSQLSRGAPGPEAEIRIGEPGHSSETEADSVANRALSLNPALRAASTTASPSQVQTQFVLSRVDCSKLTYQTCKAGIYSCGYGGSGTCGWGGTTIKCVCMGAQKPSPSKVLQVLTVIGLSVALLATVLAALADPEPATKLGLAGLTAAEVTLLLTMLGYKKGGDPGSTASSGGPTASAAMPSSPGATSTTGNNPGSAPA
jgi:hypothetical protein